MNLSEESHRWIETATSILAGYPITSRYSALEGLPCAGKTTTINHVASASSVAASNELRLPTENETNLAYLLLEPERTKEIITNIASGRVVLGDRSLISTIAFRAALINCELTLDSRRETEALEMIVSTGLLTLPSKVIYLRIPTAVSRQRQRIRDRDILEGRQWYNPAFLDSFSEATDSVIDSLALGNGCKKYVLRTDINKEFQTMKSVMRICRVPYESHAQSSR